METEVTVKRRYKGAPTPEPKPTPPPPASKFDWAAVVGWGVFILVILAALGSCAGN